jgi:beta-carotene 3-hydroxylase
MTAFGMAYFVAHDGLVHGRLPLQFLAKIRWLRVVRNAHRMHHRLESQDDALPLGLFLGQWALRRARARGIPVAQSPLTTGAPAATPSR